MHSHSYCLSFACLLCVTHSQRAAMAGGRDVTDMEVEVAIKSAVWEFRSSTNYKTVLREAQFAQQQHKTETGAETKTETDTDTEAERAKKASRLLRVWQLIRKPVEGYSRAYLRSRMNPK